MRQKFTYGGVTLKKSPVLQQGGVSPSLSGPMDNNPDKVKLGVEEMPDEVFVGMSLLSADMTDAINQQVQNELDSAHIYYTMSVWCEENGFFNSAKLLNKYSSEEKVHADKFIGYLIDRNAKPVVPTINQQSAQFASLIDLYEKAYIHEVVVEKNIRMLVDLANSENDQTTRHFLEWYLGEQIEEIKKFNDILIFARTIKDANLQEYFLDKDYIKSQLG